jgi:anti-sigma B factor antagonist
VQTDTKSKSDQLTSPAGHPVTVLRFEGDISSASKEAVVGAYQGLSKEKVKIILLDFTKVDYINSSGIALVIQVMMEAANSGQKVYAFGLSAHFQKVFTMVGITKYTTLHPDEKTACAAFG